MKYSISIFEPPVPKISLITGTYEVYLRPHPFLPPTMHPPPFQYVTNSEVISQTRKNVLDHISKHREESWKYEA